jgi:hypothetical protein
MNLAPWYPDRPFGVAAHVKPHKSGPTTKLSSRTFWTSAREFLPFQFGKALTDGAQDPQFGFALG